MKKITYVELGKYFLNISKGTMLVGVIWDCFSLCVSHNMFVNTLNSILNGTANLLNKLQSTGLYVCYLEPAFGGWTTRLQNDTGAPPNSEYSAGVCMIPQGPPSIA